MPAPVNIVLAAVGASGVISALDGVRSSLTGMAAAATGVTAAFTGFSHGLEIGSQYKDLSARTGQSVRDLVILQRALDTTGVGANNAGMMIGMFQRALSGIGRGDQGLGQVWQRLGLDPQHLKQLGIVQQIQVLTAAFSKIPNASDRAGLAMRIFGESGAQVLQLLGDEHAIPDAEHDVGRLADRLQQGSQQLDDMGNRLSIARDRLREFWVVAAQNALPTMTAMAKALENFNPAVIAAAAPDFAGAGVTLALGKGMDMALDKAHLFALDLVKTGPKLKMSIGTALSGMTGLLSKVLPIGLGLAVGAQIVMGIYSAIAQWKLERDRQQEQASASMEHGMQQQRNAMRNARSMAEIDAQRKKVAEEIAALEAKGQKKTVNTGAIFASMDGVSTPSITQSSLTEDDTKKLKELRDLQKSLNDQALAQRYVQKNQAADAQAKQLAAAQALLVPLRAQAAAYEKAAAAAKYALAPDDQKLKILDAQLKAATDLRDKELAAAKTAGDADAAKLANDKYEATSLSIAKERRDVEKQIADAKQRAADAAKRAVERQQQAEAEAQRAHAEAARQALENTQLQIQQKLSALDADYNRTDAEKWAERKQHLNEAVDAAQKYLTSMQQARELAKSPAAKAQADANVYSAQQGLYGARNQLAQVGPNLNSAPDQISSQMTRAMSSIGTLAQQTGRLWASVGESIRTSMGTALTDLFTKTGSVRSKLATFANSIAMSFAQSASQMVADWIVSHTILARVRDMFEAQSVASTAAGAGARTTIRTAETGASIAGKALDVSVHVAGEVTKTTATVAGSGTRLTTIIAEAFGSVVHGAVEAFEALASIPYVGPILGAAAMAAAFAGGIALVSKIGGHEKGGLVQGKQLSWLAESGDEFVFSAPAVRALGSERLASMHNAAKSGNIAAFSAAASPAAVGGSHAAGGGAAGRPLNVALVDPTRDRSTMQQLERDPHADTWFVNMLTRHRRTIPGVTV